MDKKVIYVGPGYTKELNNVDLTEGKEYTVLQDNGDKYLIADNYGYQSFLCASAFKNLPVKAMRMTISLSTGNVIDNREIELDYFDRKHVALHGEEFDGFSIKNEDIDNVLKLAERSHRSITQNSDYLITRYMDTFPQYYIKYE
jgi:hypothetical protein